MAVVKNKIILNIKKGYITADELEKIGLFSVITVLVFVFFPFLFIPTSFSSEATAFPF